MITNNNIKIYKENKILPFIILFLFIILNIYIIFSICNKEIEKKDILRLHIISNSNTIEDQLIKLKIEDKISNYINSLKLENNNKEKNLALLKENSNTILAISNSTLKENLINYTSYLQIGKINYDKKQSVNIDMEAGTYDSIKLVLGKGEGKNIWSLIFPNKENISKLKNYETILPGISSIYDNTTNNDNSFLQNNTPIYSFKLAEIFKELFK